MKEKIQEVQRYFKDKLLNADFEVISCDAYYLKVLIDGEYKFNIWLSSGPVYRNVISGGAQKSFMNLHLTSEDKEELFNVTEPIVFELYKKQEQEAERKRYLELKNKFENEENK